MSSKPLCVKEWMVSVPTAPWRVAGPVVSAVRSRTGDCDLVLTESQDQTWSGFGGCFNELGWTALARIHRRQRDVFFRELFDPDGDFRFNYCRLPIGANDYAASWYSHNETPGDFAMRGFSIARDRESLLPFLRSALEWQPEMSLFASPWSPPAWMKFPPVCNFGTLVWDKKHLDAYALYLAKFVQAYGKEGIRIAQIHVQNEPDSDQKFPSCVWTGERFRDFIRDHLGPAFRRAALSAEIWAGTFERGDYGAWLHPVLADSRARRFVAGLGFQWAGKEMIQRAHASWPDLPKIQTENECGDGSNSWDYAAYVFDLFQHYIANGVNAYVYWNMVLESGGRSTWGWKQNSLYTADPETRRLQRNPEFYIMRHYARGIRKGARRIRVTGRWAALSTAFANSDGTTAVVLRNPSSSPMALRLRKQNREIFLNLPGNSFHTLLLA